MHPAGSQTCSARKQLDKRDFDFPFTCYHQIVVDHVDEVG